MTRHISCPPPQCYITNERNTGGCLAIAVANILRWAGIRWLGTSAHTEGSVWCLMPPWSGRYRGGGIYDAQHVLLQYHLAVYFGTYNKKRTNKLRFRGFINPRFRCTRRRGDGYYDIAGVTDPEYTPRRQYQKPTNEHMGTAFILGTRRHAAAIIPIPSRYGLYRVYYGWNHRRFGRKFDGIVSLRQIYNFILRQRHHVVMLLCRHPHMYDHKTEYYVPSFRFPESWTEPEQK